MRLPLALCAWALLPVVPGTHSLGPRDPAKLIRGPRAVLWRSDRDETTRVSSATDHCTEWSQLVESSRVADSATRSHSTDLDEGIMMDCIPPSNSTVETRVGRREDQQADPSLNNSSPSATPRWSIFQRLHFRLDHIKPIGMLPSSPTDEDAIEDPFIVVAALKAAESLQDALRIVLGVIGYFGYIRAICRCVLPLFGSLRKFRLLERKVYQQVRKLRRHHQICQPGSKLRHHLAMQFVNRAPATN